MNLKLLEELCNTPGVPGLEDKISKIVLREIKSLLVKVLEK